MATSNNTVNIKFVGNTKGLTKSFIKANLALRAIDKTFSVLKQSFTRSFKAAEDFNTLIASQAGILTSIKKEVEGEAVANAFRRSLATVREMNEFFIDINKNTLATFEQMAIVNRELLKTGTILDINNKKQVQGFESFVNAIAIFTAGMPDATNQFRQEANAVLNGVAGKGRDVANFLKSIFGETWDEQIESMREQGTLLEEFSDIFRGFDGNIEELTNTWKVQGSTLRTISNDILRRGFQATYERLIQLTKTLNALLIANRDEYVLIVQRAWETIEEIVMRVWRALPMIGKGVAAVFTTVHFLIKKSLIGALQLFKKFEQLQVSMKQGKVLRLVESLQKVNEGMEKLRNESNRDERLIALGEKRKKVLVDLAEAMVSYNEASGRLSGSESLLESLIGDVDSAKPQTIMDTLNDFLTSLKNFRTEFQLQGVISREADYGFMPFTTVKIEEQKTAFEEFRNWVIERFTDFYNNMSEIATTKTEELAEMLKKFWGTFVDGVESSMSNWLVIWTDGVTRGEDVWDGFMQSISDAFQKTMADLIAKAAITGLLNLLFPGSGTAASVLMNSFDSSLPSFRGAEATAATGTDFLPRDMGIMAHKGEAIIPEAPNRFLQTGKLVLASPGAMGASNELRQTLSTMSFALQDLAARPIQNVIDFGETQMVQLSRQLNKSDYRRREAFS